MFADVKVSLKILTIATDICTGVQSNEYTTNQEPGSASPRGNA